MAPRRVILVLDLGSSSGRAFVFNLPDFVITGTARFDVSLDLRVHNISFNSNSTTQVNFQSHFLSFLIWKYLFKFQITVLA